MATQTPVTAEIEKWLRIRVRFYRSFWLRIGIRKKNAESCRSRLEPCASMATSDWKLTAMFRFPLVQKWNWFVRDTACSESYKIHRLHTNIAKGAITTCNILFHNVSIFDLKKKKHIETCKSNLYFAYLCNGRPELVRRSCHNSFASTIRLSIGCLNTW